MGGTELVSLEMTGARVANWEGVTLADRSAMLASVADASARRREQVQALFEALGPTAVVVRLQGTGRSLPERHAVFWGSFVAQRESYLIGLGAQLGTSGLVQLHAQRL